MSQSRKEYIEKRLMELDFVAEQRPLESIELKEVENLNAELKKLEETQSMVKSEKIILADSMELCYVVIRNETRINPKTKERDDFTQILRVFRSEPKADAYIAKLKKGLLGKGNVTFVCIPTPYGDVD